MANLVIRQTNLQLCTNCRLVYNLYNKYRARLGSSNFFFFTYCGNLSSILGAINFISTILNVHHDNVSVEKVPLLV